MKDVPVTDRLAFLAAALPEGDPVRIADVGANPLTEPPYAALVEAGLATVWGFEPDPEAFAALTPAPGVTWLPHAVGDGSAATLHCTADSGFSGLYPIHAPAVEALSFARGQVRTRKSIPVETRRLDDIAEIAGIDLLKIDAQGSELSVISNGRGKLSSAVAVIVELRFARLYDGEPMWGEVDAELRAQGLRLHKLIAPKAKAFRSTQSHRLRPRRAGSQLVDGDAVYIRAPLALDSLETAQLRALALAADSAFGSHDLVLACLDRLAERGAAAEDAAEGYADRLPPSLFREPEGDRA